MADGRILPVDGIAGTLHRQPQIHHRREPRAMVPAAPHAGKGDRGLYRRDRCLVADLRADHVDVWVGGASDNKSQRKKR